MSLAGQRDPRDASCASSRSAGTGVVAERVARARGRPDAALHQRGHGAVQARRSSARRRATTRAPRPRRSACASRASTTTSRTSAARRATTPSSRCSATSRSATTSSARRSRGPGSCVTRGLRHPAREARRHGLPRGRRGRRASGARRSASRRTASCASTRPTTSGRWATPAPAGRAPRSTTTAARSPAARARLRPRLRLRPLARDLEPRLHAVQPRRAGRDDAAAEAVRSTPARARAHGGGAPGRDLELRHRPVPADPRARAGALGRRAAAATPRRTSRCTWSPTTRARSPS